MAFGGQSDASVHESPLARRIAAILAPQWSYSRLYKHAGELAIALPLARKVILDVADEIRRDLLVNLADLEAGAQLLANENPTAVHQELVAVIVDMNDKLTQVTAKHAAKFRPFLDRAENVLPKMMGKLDMGVDDGEAPDVDRDRAGATRAGLDEHDRVEEPGRHCVKSDALVVRTAAVDYGDQLMASRPSSRAHQQDDEHLRNRNLIVISDSEEDEDENGADKHLDGNGNVEMNDGAARVPLACTDHDNEREEDVEEERGAERHHAAARLRTSSLSAARPRTSSPVTGRALNKSPSAARRPKLTRAAIRAALADDEFGSMAFGPGSPFVVTGSRCDYVLLRDVRMHFGQSTIGSMHLDRALLQTVGVHVREVCRACKKVRFPNFRCCDKWAPPGRGGAGAKKRTLLVGVARRDVFVDDDDDEEDDGDIGEPRVDEAVVASSPIPARTSRSRRSAARISGEELQGAVDRQADDGNDEVLDELDDPLDPDHGQGLDGRRGSLPPSPPPQPPRVARDRDMPAVGTAPTWPPRDAALRARLECTQFGRLLLAPDSPFIVTGNKNDAVAIVAIRTIMGVEGMRDKWWPGEPLMEKNRLNPNQTALL